MGTDTSTQSAEQQFQRHVDIFTPLYSRPSRNSRPNSDSLRAKKNVFGFINVKKWRKKDKAAWRGQFWTDAHPCNLSVNVILGNEWEWKRKRNGAAMRCGWDEKELRWLCLCPVITSFYLQQIENKKNKKGSGSKLLPGTTLDFLFGSFSFWPWFDNLARTTSSHDTFPANSKTTVALMYLDLVFRHNLTVF